jgi:hypothetical protein
LLRLGYSPTNSPMLGEHLAEALEQQNRDLGVLGVRN